MIDVSRYNLRKFCGKIKKAVWASTCIGHLEIFPETEEKIDSRLFLRYIVKDCFPLPYQRKMKEFFEFEGAA